MLSTHEIIRSLLMRTVHFFTKRHNMVVFCSFHGKQYSDNPKAISDKLRELSPGIKIVWLLRKNCKIDEVAEEIKIIPTGSMKAILALAKARVWVYNNTLPAGTFKGIDQYYIQTWHGDRGFKRVRYDALDFMGSEAYKPLNMIEDKICDLCVAGSDEGESKYRTAFRYHGEVMKFGSPRNDCLINLDDRKCNQIKRKLAIDGYRVLLYAPTFRDQTNDKQNVDIDFELLLQELEVKTGSKWVVLIRAHSLSKGLNYKGTSRVIDVSGYGDMAELLMVTDFLISDYSSTVNDYALLGRPIVLFLGDIDSYRSESRELKFDVTMQGYPYVSNMEQLIDFIHHFDHYDFKKICNNVLKNYGVCETGAASVEVCKRIIEYMEKN